MSLIESPDRNARGLLKSSPDALRYDNQTDDPHEVAGILRAAMPSGVRVLDVGCGTGSVTLIANADKGNEVLCVEPDPDRAQVARSRGLRTFNTLLDEAFLEAHGPFDVIMFADVLEHLPNPASLVELAAQGLRPGGLILASVPNVAHWTVRANLLIGRFDYTETGIYDSTHLRWFTERSFRTFIQAHGFEVLSIRQTAGVDLPVYWAWPFRHVPRRILHPVIRTLNRLLPRLIGCQHVITARKAA
jgi:2-polyprenyl-3-methyl-5-hydroxy-6-metoxy-1,4-benzoquinol methylase